jgi:predicted RNase H-like HicB family nuclease
MTDGARYTLAVHNEDGVMWAEVIELPGTFVSGKDMDELLEAATEAILMVLDDEPVRVKLLDFAAAKAKKSQPTYEVDTVGLHVAFG